MKAVAKLGLRLQASYWKDEETNDMKNDFEHSGMSRIFNSHKSPEPSLL
jgi:hypothetical protein